MKSIAFLATATIAMAGSAFAKIGTPIETRDGGEVFFSLFSQSAGTTYQLDTGILVKDFPALANNSVGNLWRFSLDATNDAAFAAFLAATGSASDISFSLMGGDNSGVTAASRSLITTVRDGGDVGAITNGNLGSGMSAMTTNYLDGISGVNSKHPAGMLSNGSSFFTEAEGNGHYYAAQTDTLSGHFAIGNDNRLGTLTAVYQFTRSSTAPLENAHEALLGFLDVRQASSDQYEVDFGFRPLTSETPEPSSVVLALIGLGACGALAARRRAD